MPTLHYRVEAAGVNILKTVTDEVVVGLLDELDLTRLMKGSVYTMSSFMSASDYVTNGAITMSKPRADIVANYILDKSQVPWPVDSPYTTQAYGVRNSQAGHYTPVFADPAANVLIEHQTVACAIELDVTLSFTSFDDATKTFDTLQAKYKGALPGMPFHLAFSYPVSFELLKLLTAIYEAKDGYKPDISFVEYINQMKQTQISFDVRKSQLDMEDADSELMIRCQQLNCLLQMNMDQKEPEVERAEKAPEIFKINFQSTIQFGRPVDIRVTTPVSVDNTLLPNNLFSSVEANSHYTPLVAGVYQDLVCSEYMRRSYGNFNQAHQLVRFPSYDNWFTVDKQYDFFRYRPFFIAHFTLDGPQTVIPLKELGEVSLHPIVQDILKEMGSAVFRYGGLFTVGVYADDLRLSENLLSLDEDLNLTISSNRNDKVYHLVLSESTNLTKMTTDWDYLLIKYRYFFPMTIERNIDQLVQQNYFTIAYDDSFLSLISKLSQQHRVKALLTEMISLGEYTNGIYAYTQNPSQLADFLVYTKSQRTDYILPDGEDSGSQAVRQYYAQEASVEGRSLFVAFIELCLKHGYITLADVPNQYLDPNRKIYPYYQGQGGYYGFNTPIRIFNTILNV